MDGMFVLQWKKETPWGSSEGRSSLPACRSSMRCGRDRLSLLVRITRLFAKLAANAARNGGMLRTAKRRN